MMHVMEIRVGICISKILEEYSVKGIYVINPSIYVRIIRSMLWGMLSENLRSKIEFEGER